MTKRAALLTLLLALLLGWQDPLYRLGRNIEIYSRVLQELAQNYVDAPDLDRLTTRAVESMLTGLDPYTNFYSAAEVTQAQLEQSGQYAGVGIVLQKVEKKVLCRRVLESSPAARAGVQPGDLLLEIERKPTQELSLEQIQQLLRGMPRTTVRIKVFHPTTQKEEELTLTRAELESESVPYATLLPGGIGYIALVQFSRDCAQALRQKLIQLKTTAPLKGLILDLRGNPGGLLNESLEILNFFLPKGELLLETRGRMPEATQKYHAQSHPLEPTLPLAVLIDEESASASEIVAGTLQDLDRAVILGKKSFGKGLVQVMRPLVENTQLKITVSRYYTPSGRCIQIGPSTNKGKIYRTRSGRPVREGGGILPDIEAPSSLPEAQKDKIESYFFYFLAQHRDKIPRDSAALLKELPPASMVEPLLDSLRPYPFTYARESDAPIQQLHTQLSENPELQQKLERFQQELASYRLQQLRKNMPDLQLLVGQLRAYHGLGLKGEYDFITQRDPLVQQAREILTDLSRYERILRP
ncbi:MAG: S41 family peptidase [Bacteroidia bacterium]|nr:S41 family peptidase [Bacteroidia bacterium]MDW8236469.1 S41 family peptidase [Bacteroidia bacterium]